MTACVSEIWQKSVKSCVCIALGNWTKLVQLPGDLPCIALDTISGASLHGQQESSAGLAAKQYVVVAFQMTLGANYEFSDS